MVYSSDDVSAIKQTESDLSRGLNAWQRHLRMHLRSFVFSPQRLGRRCTILVLLWHPPLVYHTALDGYVGASTDIPLLTEM